MTKPNYTHLSLVVDRSGSMVSIQRDAEGGINSLIKEQAAGPGTITVSLYHFDTSYEKVFGPVAASDAPVYRLVPRGGTALLDAVGRAIVETGDFLSSLPEDERPSAVKFVVATDGEENSSMEYTKDRIKEMTTRQTTTYGWEFIFLGANVDAFAEKDGLGFSGAGQYHATSASVRAAYGGVSSALLASRATGATMDSAMVNVDEQGNVV